MKPITRLAAALGLVLGIGATAFAAERTATLEVQNVSCATCAPIVKRTLSRVPGVSRVAVSEGNGTATATVTFDDARTDVAALVQATTNAGFPSRTVQ
ncbi:cation transporter [Siccirubricoccus sp. KC 17139]|uniref:Cation transporter n=1 Tax=Siccirubricoccus soli TaxID=2899147 RepID=A0ABT1D2F8_9PROT|nr:cation transporter [Siccirubricoccus soli]MCO6416090.1 cation transporter [Siccirubricoccus soli]MCP2682222.1 cation transporter [Siccirubricoccus soli]